MNCYAIYDPRFKYVPAAKTNILNTFRRFGWTPPTEADPDRFAKIRAALNGPV